MTAFEVNKKTIQIRKLIILNNTGSGIAMEDIIFLDDEMKIMLPKYFICISYRILCHSHKTVHSEGKSKVAK